MKKSLLRIRLSEFEYFFFFSKVYHIMPECMTQSARESVISWREKNDDNKRVKSWKKAKIFQIQTMKKIVHWNAQFEDISKITLLTIKSTMKRQIQPCDENIRKKNESFIWNVMVMILKAWHQPKKNWMDHLCRNRENVNDATKYIPFSVRNSFVDKVCTKQGQNFIRCKNVFVLISFFSSVHLLWHFRIA